MGDGFIIADSPAQIKTNIDYLLNSGCSASELKTRYGLGKNYADWVVDGRSKVSLDEALIVPISYRPFDTRWTYFDNRLLWRWRESVMRHLTTPCNLNLMMTRQTKDEIGALVGDSIAAHKAFSAYDITYNMPLYLIPEKGTLDQTIRVNFDKKLYARIRKTAGLTGTPAAPDGSEAFRKATGGARPDEVKVLDYIYGVLHCPAYRETYAAFLKIDFPRVPFPPSPEVFADVSAKGEALRRLHLMEEAAIGDTPYPFHGDRDGGVGKPRYFGGRVWINAEQYFENVPAVAWGFHIGGYQPAQKWLKDRRGRALSWNDIRHYQKIIKILAETDRIMHEIELPLDGAAIGDG
ncbi:type ISP restriction/modification enzyme [Sphingomonas sp. Leaf357]|uniref:type ISP restriction/modification enzyme n=1 Tax=Sphingomonas sp. Leaf357 TaxID=1736350 RepID=UPI00191C41AC|nr:type ISP restriction/modification enzyme [Sphingomonas sp. Leaf357]